MVVQVAEGGAELNGSEVGGVSWDHNEELNPTAPVAGKLGGKCRRSDRSRGEGSVNEA